MDTKKPIILNDLEEWDFTDYVDALIDKEEAVDLEFKVGTSSDKVGTSKRLKLEELESIIVSIAEDYTTLDEIASRTNRTFDYMANKIIPRMLKNGTIEYLYPEVPNHPKQKYKATNKKL